MQVVYALESFPTEVHKTIFLAGPTPRAEAISWRVEALQLLQAMGFDGHVLVPEPRSGDWAENYTDQVEWEEEGLNRADVILFWVPRDVKGSHLEGNGSVMAGLTTNDEWGFWKDSGKVVWGNPDWADQTSYQKYYAKKYNVPTSRTLEGTLQLALNKLGDGVSRSGNAAAIPAFVWKRPEFQEWYQAQSKIGNSIRKIEVLQTLWHKDQLMLYLVRPALWIAAEQRDKSFETIVFRSDISVVALYLPDAVPTESKFVLIKEFRTSVRNERSYVYELPGGSSHDPQQDPLQTAASEVSEEVGLTIAPERLMSHGSRQMGATLCGYHAHFYSAKLTVEELEKLESDREIHGEASEGEQTRIVVRTLKAILEDELVDWAMIGMICGAFVRKS